MSLVAHEASGSGLEIKVRRSAQFEVHDAHALSHQVVKLAETKLKQVLGSIPATIRK